MLSSLFLKTKMSLKPNRVSQLVNPLPGTGNQILSFSSVKEEQQAPMQSLELNHQNEGLSPLQFQPLPGLESLISLGFPDGH